MQIKLTVKYQLTPVRMVTLTKKKKLVSFCENGKKLELLWWECKMVYCYGNAVWQFLKQIKNGITVWTSNSTLWCISQRVKCKDLKWWLDTHLCSSIIHHGQKVETTQVSMDKQNVIYTYNGILFSLEKEHATTWMNLEDIMLSEISQLQKDKCIIPFLLGT